MKKKDETYTPILPFDITVGEHFHIYGEEIYVQDKALCGENSIRMQSGNILKYYEQKDVDPVKIGGN